MSRIRKVGECRVLGELGKGGMAMVYRAVHEPLQREVAIKELPAAVTKNKEAVSRFRREALALAGFRHQNIVTLYDFVEKGEGLYMVMELVDGPTLSDLIKEGPLPPDVVAVIGAQLARALEHAHFARIIHRDIKPSNVMLAKSGEVKLMDFGIARDEDLDPLTKTGLAMGTPSYMSPEQVTGEEVDARTDIYSLGTLMYEALSGQKPFTGQNAGEVFAKVCGGKCAPLSKVAPGASGSLISIVRRAMQVKPAARFTDAGRMRRALERFVARHVSVSDSALLLAFLRYRNKMTETEALARLDKSELARLSVFAPAKRSSGWWKWAAVLLLGAGSVGAYFQPLWWPMAQAILNGR